MQRLQAEILSFMAAGLEQPDHRFDGLALSLFTAQFERNLPYRRFCLKRGRTPATVRSWAEIPTVPISAFKAETLCCYSPQEASTCFMTSGTTGGADQRGKHYHPNLNIYDASLVPNFRAHLLPEISRIRMIVLNPDESVLPDSSLAHYLTRAVREFGTADSAFYIDQVGLRRNDLAKALGETATTGEPVLLLGTPFAYVHFLDWCASASLSFGLAPGSRLMETGGFKGKSREFAPAELCAWYGRAFGLAPDQVINMYGMTELSTQFYDSVLRGGSAEFPRTKVGPPWIRSRVVNPLTLADLPPGETGILAHYDLGNWASVMAILTEDMGYSTPDGGFVLLGRATGEGARGCAAAMDEFLRAAGTQS